MKRDMDLIRLLLLKQECDEAPLELAAYSDKDILYNILLMDDAKLIEAEIIMGSAGDPRGANILRVTWSGHDFLDATRDRKIWQRAKDHLIKPGVSWTFQTLLEFLRREIQRTALGGE